MSIWADSVRANFKRTMDTDISGLTTSSFTETKSTQNLLNNAIPTFNGAYSIQMNGLTVEKELNNTWAFEYGVLIRLGFIINPKQTYDADTETVVNDKVDYNEAVDDVELIITKALNASLFSATVENVELESVTPLEYRDELETLATCDLVFKCRGRTTI